MELIFFQKLALFCFWFVIGVSLVVILKQYKITKIQGFEELTFFKLFCIFFILFFIYKIILNLLLVFILKFIYFYGHINDELLLPLPPSQIGGIVGTVDIIDNLNQCMANDNSNNSSSITSNIEGKSSPDQVSSSCNLMEGENTKDNSFRLASAASDGGIMATAIAAGAKLAAKAPTPASKIAAALGGVGLGALAIGTKNVMSNLTSDMGKNTYINLNNLNLQDLLNLTGNSALDLIHMLVLFQLLQLLFLSIILYNSIIMLINEDYIENILLIFFPASPFFKI